MHRLHTKSLNDYIEIVCHKEWKIYLEQMIKKYNFSKVKCVADGGDTFQTSVINGINNFKNKICDNDIVMIHYGAAPFTSNEIIADSIRVCKKIICPYHVRHVFSFMVPMTVKT